MKTANAFTNARPKRVSAALLAALLLAAPASRISAQHAAETAESALPFSDVAPDLWFYPDVLTAYGLGLVNGKSASRFAPYDGILLSEAVKLAACAHQLSSEGGVTLSNGGEQWYAPYLAYAKEHGIVGEDMDWDRPALRGEVMEFFSRAVPLTEINEVPVGSIPDVPAEHPHAAAIYALYRAGIAQGTDESTRKCEPDVPVTRAEIAAALTRLTNPAARIRFVMNDPAAEKPDDGASAEQSAETPVPYAYSSLTLDWAAVYDTRFGEGASDEILLTDAEIDAYNAETTAVCPTMTDLAACPDVFSGEEVAAMIGKYVLPTGCDYDRNGNYIDEAARGEILANRNLAGLAESVPAVYAVVTERSDMKSFPMEDGFYPYGNPGFNKAQETELSVGTPVIVLHRSADGAFLFVLTYHYAGWIPAWTAALCEKEVFDRYVRRDPSSGVTVTSPTAYIDGTLLDMGVWLPFSGETGDGYEVLLPVRKTDGLCEEKTVSLGRDDAVPGRLPYTMKNFYEQAFRWLGMPYGWGGADGGVDCSGYVSAVLRSFGILIPRNTAEQRLYAGVETDISGMGGSDRLALFAGSRFPVAIYRQGHVMLCLGESDGKLWIVHAHSIGQPVSLAPLDPWSAMLGMVEFHS